MDTPKTKNELQTLQLTQWEINVLIDHWFDFVNYNSECFSLRDIEESWEATRRLNYIASVVGREVPTKRWADREARYAAANT